MTIREKARISAESRAGYLKRQPRHRQYWIYFRVYKILISTYLDQLWYLKLLSFVVPEVLKNLF
jgi:hypothetical protein